jgi:hypothetical protein
MEDVGIFCGDLFYFTAVGYISRPFGIFLGHLVSFSVLVRCTKKNLATRPATEKNCVRTVVAGAAACNSRLMLGSSFDTLRQSAKTIGFERCGTGSVFRNL